MHRTTANWVTQLPAFFHPYIANIIDVPGDSHCGFRVVASHYGWDNDGWKIIRKDFVAELLKYGELYDKLLSPFSTTDELLFSVECYDAFADSKN